MTVDHTSILLPLAKLDGVANFLVSSLQHTGFGEKMRPTSTHIGLGKETAYFWLVGVGREEGIAGLEEIVKKQHVGFKLENAQQVRDFHAAALKAGGTDNGPPGLRPMYGPKYYAAFVYDPFVGINFEVVSRNGED